MARLVGLSQNFQEVFLLPHALLSLSCNLTPLMLILRILNWRRVSLANMSPTSKWSVTGKDSQVRKEIGARAPKSTNFYVVRHFLLEHARFK